jgi:hypothetical protein
MVTIENGIRQPNYKTKPYKYPWDSLKVGDSFLMPHKNSPFSMLAAYNKKLPKTKRIKITSKYEGEGRRVWRIK